jgi:hypothetical protein
MPRHFKLKCRSRRSASQDSSSLGNRAIFQRFQTHGGGAAMWRRSCCPTWLWNCIYSIHTPHWRRPPSMDVSARGASRPSARLKPAIISRLNLSTGPARCGRSLTSTLALDANGFFASMIRAAQSLPWMDWAGVWLNPRMPSGSRPSIADRAPRFQTSSMPSVRSSARVESALIYPAS